MEDVSNDIHLVLGLAQYNHHNSSSSSIKLNHSSHLQITEEAPPLTLGFHDQLYGSPKSTDSNSSIKREIDDFKDSRLSLSRTSDDDEASAARKKLRLNKEQSALLEDKFKQHTSLNPKQKQALAKQLNLRPRQVEVWFQNRRARTKLKQTETDCEVLRRCCEKLTEENQRLQRELEELKSIKSSTASTSPMTMYMQMPVGPTVTMLCPSCNSIRGGAGATEGSIMAAPAQLFRSSAAAAAAAASPFARPITKC